MTFVGIWCYISKTEFNLIAVLMMQLKLPWALMSYRHEIGPNNWKVLTLLYELNKPHGGAVIKA